MFKMIGALLVLVASSAFGFCLCEEFEQKQEILATLLQMMQYISDRIMTECDSLSEAFIHTSARMEEPYSIFLAAVSERMDGEEGTPLARIWQEECSRLLEAIGEEETQQLLKCMDQTGFADRAQQTGQIGRYCEYLQKKLDGMEKTKADKCKIYKTIGIMAGILCVVILW